MADTGAVRILSPEGAIKPTGTWSLGARAGDFIFVAGMRGIDPATNTLVVGPEATNQTSIPEHDGRREFRGCSPARTAFV